MSGELYTLVCVTEFMAVEFSLAAAGVGSVPVDGPASLSQVAVEVWPECKARSINWASFKLTEFLLAETKECIHRCQVIERGRFLWVFFSY